MFRSKLIKTFDILIRLRFNSIAILANIKQAFLNVEISKEQRDNLRFFYYDEAAFENEPIIYRFYEIDLV